MSYYTVKHKLNTLRNNLQGWSTDRKILVIESDDWGSIRMPSRETYQKCITDGYRVDNNPYEKYDALETADDLELLFGVLSGIADKSGNSPVITANCAVANPDFTKIRNSGFQSYHYKSIIDTFSEYPKSEKNFSLWKAGVENKVFFPQFHVREHLNVSKYMSDLKSNDVDIKYCFDHELLGAISKDKVRPFNNYVEATRFSTPEDKNEKGIIIETGLKEFEALMGYSSCTYIPANYTISEDYFPLLVRANVRFLQGINAYFEPAANGTDRIKHKRVNGEIDKSGLISLVRNCRFEPALISSVDEVNSCLFDVNTAFLMNKPAIISSHRLNFIGRIHVENRDKNLKLLQLLLQKIIEKWPNVEFKTSAQLGEMIQNSML